MTAEEVLRADTRPPVLYFRSFVHDSISQGRQIVAPYFIGPAVRAEDILAAKLNSLGPFIAIGRPGDALPETGAYRLYVNEDEWKVKVAELLSGCRLVVILARGATEGLLWEIQQAKTTLRSTQLIFFFPYEKRDREQHYQAFVESVQQYFPFKFPEALSNAYFIAFLGDSWVPWIIGAKTTHSVQAGIEESLEKFILSQGVLNKPPEPTLEVTPFWQTNMKREKYVNIAKATSVAIMLLCVIAYAIRVGLH